MSWPSSDVMGATAWRLNRSGATGFSRSHGFQSINRDPFRVPPRHHHVGPVSCPRRDVAGRRRGHRLVFSTGARTSGTAP